MNFRNVIYSIIALLYLSINLGTAQELSDIEAGKIRVKFTEEFEAVNLSMSSTASVSSSARMSSMGSVELKSVNEQHNVTIFRRVFPFSEKHEARHRKHGLHLWYEVQFSSTQDPREVVESYNSINGVTLAKPVYKKVGTFENTKPIYVSAARMASASTQSSLSSTFFDDPLLVDQWHYENDGLRVGTADSDIDLEAAWEINTGSPEVIIAIVDGGIDVAHEDLAANLWVNEIEKNGEIGVDDDGNGYIDDIHGYNFHSNGQVTAVTHGTHVAGTVAAVSNNGVGVAGVAGGDGSEGSGIRMMSCQIFQETGSSHGAAAAYIYAADNGAVIAQSSWGYTSPGVYEQDVQDALRYFVEEAGNTDEFPNSPIVGGLPIFTTGNNGMEDVFYPAADQRCLSVNAVGPTNLPTSYTNHGTWTNISAPGGDMSFGEIGQVLSTFPGNKYGYLQGTSMACPHVSGVAGLVLSELGNEISTADELKARIMQGAADFPAEMHSYYNGKMGVGILNARAALQSDGKLPPENITDLRVDNLTHTALDLIWTVPSDEDDESPYLFYLWLSTEEITEDYLENFSPYIIPNTLAAGDTAQLNIEGLRKQTSYYFALQAVDRWGNTNEVAYTSKQTLDEPLFSFSPKNISVEIDVTEEKVVEEYVHLRNDGESPLLWEGFVENNGPIFNEEDESEEGSISSLSSLFKTGPKIQMLSDGRARLNFGGVYDVNGQMGFASVMSSNTGDGTFEVKSFYDEEIRTDTLTDRTRYIAGLQHEFNDNSFDFGFTEPSANMGYVSAVRYEIPLDYRLPLTHMEALWWLEEGMKDPFVIEICKGGQTVFEEMEVLHAQTFYPREESLGFWTWNRVPFSRAIETSGGDIIWVKIYHPKAPLTYQAVDYSPQFPGWDYFISHDEGRSFQTASVELPYGGYAIPKVRLFSAGEDPAHVYFDPISGQVAGGTEEQVRLVIDGSHLTEGKHETAAVIYTNDTNYPIGTVAVDMNILGQKAIADYERDLSLGVTYAGAAKDVKFKIKNTGFANLEITGIELDNPEIEYTGADTLIIEPNFEGELAVRVTPTTMGVFSEETVIKSNIGDLEINFYGTVKEPAVAQFSAKTLTAETRVGEKVEVSFEVENTSDQVLDIQIPLAFDEKHGNSVYLEDHANASDFEDISTFGISVRDDVLNAYATEVSLGFKFPFFNEEFENITLFADGLVWLPARISPWLGSVSAYRTLNEFPSEEGLLGTFAVMGNEMIIVDDVFWKIPSESDLLYADLGDRFIVQYDNVKSNLKDEEEGRLTAQLVLFQDGAIEFRYENIDANSIADNALVGFQNLEGTVGYTLQKRDAGRIVKANTSYRFVREHGANFVSAVSEKNFSLKPSETKTITVELDPEMAGLTDGTHHDMVFMNTNTADGYEKVDIELQVNGYAQLELAKGELNFEPVMVGLSDTASFFIENIGTAPMTVSQLFEGSSIFTINQEVPFTVAAGERKQILLTYSPTTKEEVSEQWLVTSEGIGQQSIEINSSSFLSPEPTAELSDLIFSLKTLETDVATLTIANTIDTDLNYTIEPTSIMKLNTNDGEVNGYTYRDSHYDAQVRYEWIDIAEEENKIYVPTDGFVAVELPFSYTFYGETFDSIWVCENGYITSKEPQISSDPQYGPHLPDDGISGVMAPMRAAWTLNSAEDSSGIYMSVEENRVIVEYKRVVSSLWGNPGYATFEVILQADGLVKFQYKEVDNFNGEIWYGLKDLEGKTFVDIGRAGHDYPDVYNTRFEDYQAIIFQPKVSVTIQGEGSKTHELTMTSDRLEEGIYVDTLVVISNSYSTPEIRIPISYTVEGVLDYTVSRDTLDYGNVFYVEDDIREYSQDFSISNVGTKELVIERMSLPDFPEVKLKLDGKELYFKSDGELISNVVLEAGESIVLTLVFEAEEVKTYDSELVLYDQDLNRTTIKVVANSVLPPVFELESTDLVKNMNVVDTLSHAFMLKNTGNAPLIYTAKAGYEFTSSTAANTVMSAFGLTQEEVVAKSATTFDSIHYDISEKAAATRGNRTNTPIRTAVRMTAPAEGFTITHLRMMVDYLFQDYVRVEVYDGSSNWPDGGNQLFEQDFLSTAQLGSSNWMLLEFDRAVNIQGGEDFYIVMSHPEFGEAAYDLIDDENIYKRNFFLPSIEHQIDQNGGWFSGDPDNTIYDEVERYVWKVRALSFQANWIELDAVEGVIDAGASQEVNSIVLGNNLAQGLNVGYVSISTNDPVKSKAKVNYEITANASPQVTYSPDQYGEAVKVAEGESKIVNLLAIDPEDDHISFEIVSDSSFATVEKVESNQAQVRLSPSHDDQGAQEVELKVIDEHGNYVIHPFSVYVEDVNRTPQSAEPWAVNLLLEQPIGYTITVAEVFEDQDGDTLQYGAVNDTPDIIDVAYGQEDLVIIPKSEGVGIVYILADDGKENGFTYIYVVVYVYSEESYTNTYNTVNLSVYPNPIVDEVQLSFETEARGKALIEVINLEGDVMKTYEQVLNDGNNQEVIYQVAGLPAGVYLIRISTSTELIGVKRIVVK
ncbi:putative secreted protein (Por secretion system target) [Sediminitomix flava]|uniref:Putative secreted protein (Por secretion system target) n=2 Tax=Sediminitomix flava TaxID=379075 RepID=A0A315Z8G3_SEDFL|nr:putative secreted protein (Por secretion system target) [Sediminitomix flava]